MRSRLRFLWMAPPGFGARRLWFAFTAFSALSVCRKLWSNLRGKAEEGVGGGGGRSGGWLIGRMLTLSGSRNVRQGLKKGEGAEAMGGSVTSQIVRMASNERVGDGFSAEAPNDQQDQDIVTEKDLEHLLQFLDGKVVDTAWQQFMERTTPNMVYQAWRHEPEDGPLMYRSRTVFEDATPELVRDFFWDDDFRPKWDTMLAYFKVLEELPHVGSMIVHWIKKFPFFCSDREYIVGRRIWESGNTYYCVTKNGMSPVYDTWIYHGEQFEQPQSNREDVLVLSSFLKHYKKELLKIKQKLAEASGTSVEDIQVPLSVQMSIFINKKKKRGGLGCCLNVGSSSHATSVGASGEEVHMLRGQVNQLQATVNKLLRSVKRITARCAANFPPDADDADAADDDDSDGDNVDGDDFYEDDIYKAV
ncbi:Bet v1-like protein [Dioscorea alata]|uniref:Bet v1-like protein n=1 Tax=Dioscorea alata TaxID=55571 RepID=A0ACB7ULX2_DIOAL|nr:Bet v1-like protein [Dioscorea alata]